ncbi:DUF6642 family protein [Hymenobacter actinosclerus]|uniref:CHAT domain-containing protein n=1 Tax=Hymenobacter actinosclerus TaxID=82805 RepID=A0A1I0DNB8_9BACT|nr:hypothetical protein [Hymenobacter actinosclerus]SET34001.1 hypothetical protein SAMN04487998_1481 [Hymenobacter actinosclerus]
MKVKIHCFEGEWDNHSELSIRPLIHVLERAYLSAGKQLVYTFKLCQTIERLKDDLRASKIKFSKSVYQNCLYFAFHGSGHGLYGNSHEEYISFDDIAKTLGKKAAGSIVLFGSCGSYASQKQLERFKEETDATLVVGYSSKVSWIESSIFEMIFFSELCRYEQVGSFKNRMQKLSSEDQLLFSKLKVRFI